MAILTDNTVKKRKLDLLEKEFRKKINCVMYHVLVVFGN
jgi:hypothetical protein